MSSGSLADARSADRCHAPPAAAYGRLKRATDLLLTGGALVVLSPVLLATAALVRVKLGRPVLFRQRRVGLHGEPFEILKFRTMLDADPARGLSSDEDRMTPLGSVLRATSLDELPGLLNVLRGDMSLVGPRPLLPPYLERYSQEQSQRHEVLPGLTGLAQVSGRNSLSWDDKFDLDLHYVRTRSPMTDLRILCATVPKVLGREGVTEDGQVTMTDFYGPRRIGGLEIRPREDGTPTGRWEVAERRTGDVLAHCVLDEEGEKEMQMSVRVEPGCENPEEVRTRAVEMLLGLAREQGAESVRLIEHDGEAGADLPERLGFRADPTAGAAGASTLVRTLGRCGL